MVRPVSSEKEREYAELNAFMDMYATHFMKLDPGSSVHPTKAGAYIVATYGKSKALVGLRQAINDCVEDLKDLSGAQVTQLDEALRARGIVTLTELRRRYSRQFRAIHKRGLIRNETEFYLIKGILDECDAALTDAEKSALGSMLLAFENDS